MSRGARTLAVAVRDQAVAATVVDDGNILLVQRFCMEPGDTNRVAAELRDLGRDYAVQRTVVERSSTSIISACRRAGLRPVAVTLDEAKHELLGDANASHNALYDRMVEQHPQLERFVDIMPGTSRVLATAWRRQAVLLSAALGRAYQRTNQLI